MPNSFFMIKVFAGFLLVTSILPIYNFAVFQPEMSRLLVRSNEEAASRTARHFINEFSPDQQQLFKHPLTTEQDATIRQLQHDYDIVKIKILSPEAAVIYSTSRSDIGKRDVSPEFFSQVRQGQTVSQVITRNMPGVAGGFTPRDLINVLVPVQNGQQFTGAFEFCFDITQTLEAVKQLNRNSTTLLCFVALTVVVLFVVVGLKMKETAVRQIIAEKEVSDLAYRDQLTGLPNRTLFLDRLKQAISHSQREAGRVALLYMDLDRFKDINDSLGHHKGDQLLQMVATRLTSLVRSSDTLARIAGDEFVLLLGLIHKDDDASVVSRHITELLAEPFSLEEREVFVTMSIGISLYPENGCESEVLLQHADTAMYSAKQRGGNTYAYFSAEMHAEVQRRLDLENDLRNALAQQQFVLAYQPQFDLFDNRLVAAEVLLRWNHPQKGLVAPGQFIPIAEETGLIGPIGEWVLEEACRQSVAWQQQGFVPLRLAVNLSAQQFRQDDLVEMVDRLLKKYALPSHLLELELTESLVMDDAEAAIASLSRFRARGIHLAIDDFGTGYSSLSYLRNFPVDRIKIDRSFVGQLPHDRHSVAIVEAILAMARALDLQVVAEGAENQAQIDFLKNRYCNIVQGFFLGRPQLTDDFTKLFLEPLRKQQSQSA